MNKIKKLLQDIYHLKDKTDKCVIPAKTIDIKTIEFAEIFIAKFCNIIEENNLLWKFPHIGTDGEGEISLEWWSDNNTKVLTIFVNPSGEIDYLKSWGTHIYNDMDDGTIPSDEKLLYLCKWFME